MFKRVQAKCQIIGGILLLFAISSGVQAQTADVNLCLAIDGSGSLTASEFDLQREGYALAIEDASIVPRDGSVTFVVVQFGSSVTTEISARTISSESDATTLAADIRAISFQSGSATATGTAIEQCTSEISGLSGRRVIDVSTDGGSNQGTFPPDAADAAVAAGIDAINLIGIGDSVNEPELNATARPQPATELPEAGFVVLVGDFAGFDPAIEAKIRAEITGGGPSSGPVVVPTMSRSGLILLMLVLAVFGAGFIGWRKF